MLVIIQRDEQNEGYAFVNAGPNRTPDPDIVNIVKSYIQTAIDVFKEEANVRIIPSAPDGSYLHFESSPSDSDTLDVCCDTCAFAVNLGTPGAKFRSKMAAVDFSGAGRRLIGVGSPVCAFAVRGYSDGKTGCCIPESDYITVGFKIEQALTSDQVSRGRKIRTTLAHELGHACNLGHAEFWIGPDLAQDNLMTPSTGVGRGPRGTSLTAWQKSVLRSSRHVIY